MDTQQLHQIGNSVCGHFLSLDVHQIFDDSSAARTGLEYYVEVELGDAGCVLLVGANRSTASQLAADMFDCVIDQLAVADLEDALGEVTNMLGSQVGYFLGMKENVGIPNHISEYQMKTYWRRAKVDTEALVLVEGSPVYIAVVETAD